MEVEKDEEGTEEQGSVEGDTVHVETETGTGVEGKTVHVETETGTGVRSKDTRLWF